MKEMFASFLSTGTWSVIKAVLLLILALIVAKIAKSLIVKLLTKTKISYLLEKTGKFEKQEKIISFLLKNIYIIILIMFFKGIFD